MASVLQILLGLLVITSGFASCQTRDVIATEGPALDAEKVLIVYLSRTKNTKALATIIHENTGGNLVALQLVSPYPDDYKMIVEQVAKENETGFLPPLKTRIENIEKYDVVFVGFPTWGMQLPPPMKAFLKQYNLSGKTVVPFNSNAGYGVGSSIETVRQLCPNSKVLEAYSTKGGIERDGVYLVIEGEKKKQAALEIKKWLKQLQLIR